MESINKQDVLIRLLKDGHINELEFKALYEPEQTIIPYYPIQNPYPVNPYYYTTGNEITVTNN